MPLKLPGLLLQKISFPEALILLQIFQNFIQFDLRIVPEGHRLPLFILQLANLDLRLLRLILVALHDLVLLHLQRILQPMYALAQDLVLEAVDASLGGSSSERLLPLSVVFDLCRIVIEISSHDEDVVFDLYIPLLVQNALNSTSFAYAQDFDSSFIFWIWLIENQISTFTG